MPPCANPIGAHHGRHDLDHDTYVPEVAWALQERDSKGSDNSTKDGHLIPVPIQSINMKRERKQNGIGIGQPGDEMYTLTARDHHAVAFSCKDHGQDAQEDLSPTLRAMNEVDANANGGGQVAIAFQTRIARNGRGQPEEICPALNGSDAGATSDMRPLVAFTENQRNEVRELEVAGSQSSIRRGDAKNETLLQGCFGVRRLTPTECEILQGFPKGWTDFSSPSQKRFSDSLRYKILGNAVPPPLIRWLARRMKGFYVTTNPN